MGLLLLAFKGRMGLWDGIAGAKALFAER